MTDLDAALTDYGLAIESAVFAYLLAGRGGPATPLRAWFAVFFGAVGAAALAGGTVHGFLADGTTAGARLLWLATLLSTGVAALAAWNVGARILCPPRVARGVALAAGLQFVAYAAVVLGVTRTFAVAIAAYLPAALFLAAALARAYRTTRAPAAAAGLVGLALMLVASALQQARLAPHPVHFDHNALYHTLVAAALIPLFRCARWLGGPRQPAPHASMVPPLARRCRRTV